jgi:hypothetical protein
VRDLHGPRHALLDAGQREDAGRFGLCFRSRFRLGSGPQRLDVLAADDREAQARDLLGADAEFVGERLCGPRDQGAAGRGGASAVRARAGAVPSRTSAMASPGRQRAPAARRWCSVPDASASSSSLALDVSTTATGSPAPTGSPSLTSQSVST